MAVSIEEIRAILQLIDASACEEFVLETDGLKLAVRRTAAEPSAPGAPAFVEVGSRVAAADTVCILEIMKLMNSIAAGVRGRVARICVENATLVEYGQPLVLIEPEGPPGA